MKIFKSIIAGAAGIVLFYLFGAFGQASFNINDWLAETRAYIGFLALCSFILLFCIVYCKD